VLAAHNFHKNMILGEIAAKMVALTLASAQAPEAVAASTSVSATASASTTVSTTANTHATKSTSPTEHDEVAVQDGPEATQDAPSTLPNPFL
jgi:hypothetical protein